MNIRIALHGSCRSNNFGDTLLMQIFTTWIRNAASGVGVTMPFATPNVRQLVGVEQASGLEALRNASALVYGGGGYFGEPDGNTLKWGLRLVKNHYPVGLLSWMRRKPISIVGVGAGPLSNPLARKAVGHICSAAECIAVRDNESYQYLVRYGVQAERLQVTADAALTLQPCDVSEEEREWAASFLRKVPGPIRVGIHLSHSDVLSEQIGQLKEDIVELVKGRRDIGVVLIVDHEGARDQIAHAGDMLSRLDRQALMYEYANPNQLVALLGSLEAVITTKLHVGIVASALGKNVLAVPKHSKTPRLYKQLGASEQCVPLREYRKGDIQSLAERFVAEGASFKVPSTVRAAAERNREIVIRFVQNVAAATDVW